MYFAHGTKIEFHLLQKSYSQHKRIKDSARIYTVADLALESRRDATLSGLVDTKSVSSEEVCCNQDATVSTDSVCSIGETSEQSIGISLEIISVC